MRRALSEVNNNWWFWNELKMPIEYTIESQNIFKYSWKLIKNYKLFKISYPIKKWKEYLSEVKNSWWCWKELKIPIEYTVESQNIFKYSWKLIKNYKLFKISYPIKKWKEYLSEVKNSWWCWKELKITIEYTVESQNIFKYSWKLIKNYKLFKISYPIKKWKEYFWVK